MINLKKATEQRHPQYRETESLLTYYRDHYEGGALYPTKFNPLPMLGISTQGMKQQQTKGNKALGNTHYLWQYPLERSDKYIHRIARACYINIIAPVVDFYCATVGKPENVLVDPDGKFDAFLDNADRQGQSFLQFMSACRTNATVRGLTFILIDAPNKTLRDGASEYEAQQLGIEPYLCEVLPENLLNWRLDMDGVPREILYRVKTEVAGSLLDEGEQKTGWQYRYVTRDIWQTFEEDSYGTLSITDEGTNQLGAIPIVPLYHKRIAPWRGESLLKDSAKIGQLVTNWCSSLDEIFECSMFPVPVLTSQKSPEESGAGTAVMMHLNPEEGEDFKYVSPDTATFEAGWDAFYRLVQLANKHMGIAPKAITTDKMDTQSGTSKEWDFFEAEKILARMGLEEQESAKKVMEFVALYKGAEYVGTIQYASKYDLASAAEDIADLLSLQAAGAPPTAKIELLRRVINKKMPSLPEDVAQKIKKELDGLKDLAPPMAMPPGGAPPGPGGKTPPPDSTVVKTAPKTEIRSASGS